MATRVTDGARRSRVPRLRHSRARALLSLNLKKKRDCSQSMFDLSYKFELVGASLLALAKFIYYLSIS